ncbi:MAG: putative cadmium-transporting ATPase [Chlamydiae bacterium]|nr:putative cadmium-transporting ATPase [Chlamydiota bacterium]
MWKNPKLLWLIFSAILVTIFELLSLAGIKLPPSDAIPVFSIIILIIGYRIIWKGLKALVFLNFRSINLLMVVAVVGAFYIGEYEEAAVVIVLFALAERLEDIGIARSKSSLDALVQQIPKYAYVKGMDEPIDAAQVSVGEVIVVKPHHQIPLDGEVIGGQSFVDESTITGEPIPQDKRSGELVFAGTLNKQGVLEVRVTKKAEDSTLARIQEMTFEAFKHKAKTQKFIEGFSSYYTPGIMGLAVFWTLASWALGRPFDVGFGQSLALLVIACPCALVISTPISIYSAIGNASSVGVLIKGGRYLEAMGQVKAIAFDKTRTLTYGEPIVTDVVPFGNNTREDLLGCAAGVELFSEHPLAQSVVEAAKREKVTPHEVGGFESVVGKGAKAECLVCYDRHRCVGKLEFILEEHHVPKEVIKEIEKLQGQGKTVIVISTHKEVVGLIALEDEIRPESPAVIKKLNRMGIESVMLTGDHEITAKAVAKHIGIKNVKAKLLPEDKVHEVENLVKKYDIVAMVGDGVNDAPALASANVGISMTTLGSDTAVEAASIVILNDHLDRIPYLIRLGKQTLDMIRFNTGFAIVIKFLFIILAITGIANLAMAIFADVGVTLLVILNSLRLLKFE